MLSCVCVWGGGFNDKTLSYSENHQISRSSSTRQKQSKGRESCQEKLRYLETIT